MWRRSRAAAAFDKFQAKLGESHRGVILSMDLLQEANAAPWLATFAPSSSGGLGQALLEFISTKPAAKTDFAFAFDGRNRQNRRAIEDAFDAGGKTASELLIVYTGEDGPPGARQRRFSWAKTRSVVWLRCLRQGMR